MRLGAPYFWQDWFYWAVMIGMVTLIMWSVV